MIESIITRRASVRISQHLWKTKNTCAQLGAWHLQHLVGPNTFSTQHRYFWNFLASAATSFVETIAPQVVSKGKQLLFGPEKTESASTSASYNVDYAAMLSSGVQGLDVVTKAIKDSPQAPEVAMKEIEQQIEKEKLKAAKEQRDSELTRTYKETAIVDRWVENHQGFAALQQSCFQRQLTLGSVDGVSGVKSMIEKQMTDKQFTPADINSMLSALDDVVAGHICEDHISLNRVEYSNGSFQVRAGGLWIQKYDTYQLVHREFRRGDRVVVEHAGHQLEGVVHTVTSAPGQEISAGRAHTISISIKRVQRNGAIEYISIPRDKVFDAETGHSEPPAEVKTGHPGYAIQIHFGYSAGDMSQPILYEKLRTTDVVGNKEVISERIEEKKLPRHWKPDELAMVEQVALGLSSRQRLDAHQTQPRMICTAEKDGADMQQK